mmetsp:Transcript_60043/g.142152  ORF Transcript_60043/g.142152 Transcript_60043/m.142152 type:complete len:345 (-) Transcript_60043:389-1423(-)
MLQPVLDAGPRGAVEVAVHLGPLEELAASRHRAELVGRDEPVLAPVLFLAARRTRGVRDRDRQPGVQLQQCLDQAGLAGATGRRDDEEIAGIFHGRAYSMFWTCSRICSIATFISTEIFVSSRAADLEPRVLASRCNSWIRKSSRLPSSPPFFSSRVSSSRWARSRPSSSATSMRMANAAASFSARSCKASCGTLDAAPVAWRASCQRSRKRCCWRATTAGSRGSASAASSRSRAIRSSRMATSFSPSRSRDSARPSTQALAASSVAASSATAALPPLLHQCKASCTDSGLACGSQALTLASRLASRLSCSGCGWGQPPSASRCVLMRSSILPRLNRAEISSRS